MSFFPHEVVRLTKAKQAEYEKEAERERLLNETQGSAGVRAHLALLLYGLAARLAPEVGRFDQRNLARSKLLQET